MNEDLETSRADATKRVLAAMTTQVEDTSKSWPERLEAAAVVKGISQDLILADLSSRGLMQDSDIKKRLINSVDKLDRHDREP